MDQPIDHTTDDTVNSAEDASATEQVNPRGRRAILGLAGAGLAGAAVLGRSASAAAADGDPVTVGGDFTGDTVTAFTNTTVTADIAGPANAIKGSVESATNGSHAILGTTVGTGHAIAGVVGAPDNPTDNGVGATWGRHYGPGAAVEGQSKSVDQPIAGPANGVKGTVDEASNGSHAVLGITMGGGHAVAGDIPADTGNTVGATWGRHAGMGAGAEGINTATAVPIAGPANGVKGTVGDATNGSHAVLGITNGGGHSVAGDTPAGAPNTVAATWGRHGGAGAGIGGISAAGYGGEFVGGLAQVRLIQTADPSVAGAPTEGDHKLGELYADGVGDLYYNQADGLAFTKVTEQNFVLDDAVRVYDSRDGRVPTTVDKGKIVDDEIREIDIAAITDTFGARAAVVNLTVTETESDGGGYLSVFNADTADADAPLASSINWWGAGVTVANGLTVRMSADGKVKVRARNATHFIIDVTGFLA